MTPASFDLSRRQVLTAAAGLAAAASLPARAQTLEKLQFMTEFAPHGFHAPFYLAIQNGWFKEAGIDLDLKDGRGTAATINLVGAGQVEVGFVNLSGAVIARSKGVPVKAIASILHKGTNGLIMKPGTGIRTPQQMRGKTVLYGTTTIEAQLLDGYLATAGMTREDVKMLGVDSASKVAGVLGGKGDVAIGPVPYYLGLLEGKPEHVETVLFDDAGIHLLDFGLVAQDSTITARPKVLASFVKVVSRAYDYTRTGNNVDEAVKAMITLRPNANIDPVTAVNMFKSHALHIPSPATVGKPVGFLVPQEMRETVKTLKDIKVIEAGLNPEETYTISFNP